MRVAIVQEHIDAGRGGAETSTLELARELARLGPEVTLVCAGRHPAPPGIGVGGVRSQVIGVHGPTKLRRTRHFAERAAGFYRAQAFDIVHAITPCAGCHVYQPRGGTYAETVRRSVALARGPLWRLVRSVGRRLNLRQRFLLRLERELLASPRPPFVAAVSDYVRRQVERDFPEFPCERLRVVFNGVSIAPGSADERARWRIGLRTAFGLDERTPLVLFVAHNFRLKGLAELIRAIAAGAAAVSPPPVLLVVGRDRTAPYARLAKRCGVGERVQFFGPVDDIRRLYAAADVLAHPTWYDPCSRVVLEALCCGLPVVTTRFNGAAEVIEPDRHGVVIESPADIPSLVDAIGRCLRADVRTACAADAERMRQRLSMARHARALLDLYEEAQRGVPACGSPMSP